jgi:transcription initiation factor TFIIB
MSSSDRTLVNGTKEIGEMADKIHVPKTAVDLAQNLFKQVHQNENLKGTSTHAITAACLYIVCRQECVPRTFKEICAVSQDGEGEISTNQLFQVDL